MLGRAWRQAGTIPLLGPLLRSWRGRFIAFIVVGQSLLPLHYYVANRDHHDERFAWRMFSPERMTRCSLAMNVDGRPLDLEREFHEAWLELGERGRLAVIEAMAARTCRRNPASEVKVRLVCTNHITNPGQPDVRGGFDLCDVPRI